MRLYAVVDGDDAGVAVPPKRDMQRHPSTKFFGRLKSEYGLAPLRDRGV